MSEYVVLKQVMKISNAIAIRQGAPCCLILSSYTTAANGTPGAKRDAYDWLVCKWNKHFHVRQTELLAFVTSVFPT